MYRKHFGLRRHAFSKEIDADDLFVSAAMKELEKRLNHLIELRGIGLVTGESGPGKTTVCRKVLSSLHTGLYRVVYVQHSTGNVMDTYKTIAWELGLSIERSRAALFRQIRSEVTRLASETRCRPVLLVDEAHHLRADVLEDLRLLTNYAMDSENRLTLVFVGHRSCAAVSVWPRMRRSASASSCARTWPDSVGTSWNRTWHTSCGKQARSYRSSNLRRWKPFSRLQAGSPVASTNSAISRFWLRLWQRQSLPLPST